jgi:hypothetical protein
MRLGWLEPKKIVKVDRGESKTLVIGPLSSGKSGVRVIKLPLTSTTYYLIENRQPVGPDQNIPSSGILIYYCDDEISECRHGTSPVKLMNADPSVPELRGAPFTHTGKREYQDKKQNVSIKVMDKIGENFRLWVANNI